METSISMAESTFSPPSAPQTPSPPTASSTPAAAGAAISAIPASFPTEIPEQRSGPGTVDVPMSEPELGIIIPAGPAASLPPTSALPIPTSPARPHRLPLAPPATAPVSRVAPLPNGVRRRGMGIVGVPQPSPLHPNGVPRMPPAPPPDVPRRYRPTPDQHGPPLRGMLVGEGYSANTPLTLPGGVALPAGTSSSVPQSPAPEATVEVRSRESEMATPTGPTPARVHFSPRPTRPSLPSFGGPRHPVATTSTTSQPHDPPAIPSSDSSAPPEDRQASGAASPPPPLDDPTTAVLAGADTVLAPTTPRDAAPSPRPSQLGGGLLAPSPRPAGAAQEYLGHLANLTEPPESEASGGVLPICIGITSLKSRADYVPNTALVDSLSHLSLSRHDLSNPLRLLAGTNATLNPLFFHTEDVIGVFSYARQHCSNLLLLEDDYVATRPFLEPYLQWISPGGLLSRLPNWFWVKLYFPDYLRKYSVLDGVFVTLVGLALCLLVPLTLCLVTRLFGGSLPGWVHFSTWKRRWAAVAVTALLYSLAVLLVGFPWFAAGLYRLFPTGLYLFDQGGILPGWFHIRYLDEAIGFLRAHQSEEPVDLLLGRYALMRGLRQLRAIFLSNPYLFEHIGKKSSRY
ncbi:hypothetical protein PAPYR_6570 [Paratrimastix pyriformis]|uniref:Uncharacterized protein n=1 Tax=Paratrimastix pyriformis TaxID=342808 RepID=A0ABQ8UIY1_9EUKA|nr:hypothetical protein PAPYR_6570 [Paratrimastix pyriformis]